MSTSASYTLPADSAGNAEGRQIVLVEDESQVVHVWDVQSDTELLLREFDGTMLPPKLFREDLYGTATARGNLYIGHDNGVAKFMGGSRLEQAGLLPAAYLWPENDASTMTVQPNASYHAIAPNMTVAYRVVCVGKDDNGLEVRSRPSGAFTVWNSEADPVRVRVAIRSPAPYRATFDKVEVYRTNAFPAGATLDEEYQLVGAVPVSAFDTDGLAVFVDDVAPANRGATLYTSPSREGMEGANDRPPACGCMARFKSSVFFGNTVGPRRFILNYNPTAPVAVAATFTVGSNVLTVVGAPSLAILASGQIRQGMMLTKVIATLTNDEYRDPDTWVAYTTASTIVLNRAMLASETNVDVFFAPGVQLDQTHHVMSDLARDVMDPDNDNFGRFIAYELTPPKSGYAHTLVIESLSQRESFNPALRASHGDTFDPPVPNFPLRADFDQDVTPGVLRWSKPDEPEHVPTPNYAFVGDKGRAILALAVTRDALLIFKEDGLFRLTGVNGTWSIEPFEPTLRCVLPSSVVEMAGDVYALTSRGLARITDSDVQIVSLTIADLLRPVLGYLGPQTGPKTLGGRGYKAGVNERDGEYVLLLENEDHPTVAFDGALVYNANTKSFSTWTWSAAGSAQLIPSALGQTPTGKLAIGSASGALATFPRLYSLVTDPPDLYVFDPLTPFVADGLSEVLNLTASVTPGTYTFDGAWIAAPGDVVVHNASGRFYTVLSASAGTLQLNVANGAPVLTAGAFLGTVYRPLTCMVEPRTFWEPQARQKLFFHVTSQFSSFVGPLWLRETFRSSNEVGTEVTTVAEETLRKVGSRDFAYQRMGTYFRQLIPRAHARAWHLSVRITWQMLCGGVKLEGIFTEARPHETHRPAPEGEGP